MNDNGFTASKILRAAACVILDAAMIIIFVKVFSFFSLLAPIRSVLALLVLLIGLAVVNVVIIAPGGIYNKIGIAHSAAIGFLLVLYAAAANVVSVLTVGIPSLVWYIVWQLLLLGIFILIFAVIAASAKRSAQSISANQAEAAARGNVALMLSDMQVSLSAREGDPAFASVAAAFGAMKERINVSTPFGRIQGNSAVDELENRIMGNLSLLQNEFRVNLSAENAARLRGIMEDTRRMIISRETLSIQ